MKEVCFIHIQGGKLYGIKNTGQMLYAVLMVPKGLKPSLARPKRTFRGFTANSGCSKSNVFNASASLGCLINPSLLLSVTCHLICSTVFRHMNNLCNLAFNKVTHNLYNLLFSSYWGSIWMFHNACMFPSLCLRLQNITYSLLDTHLSWYN